MDSGVIVTVPTGERSQYRFVQKMGSNPWIEVSSMPEGHEGHGHPYHTFEGKGATAILRLMERAARLEQFFQDVCKISICDLHGNRLTEFMAREDADEEDFEEAYDRVAELVEEQSLKEDIEAGRIKFVRDT